MTIERDRIAGAILVGGRAARYGGANKAAPDAGDRRTLLEHIWAETADFFWQPLCSVVHNGILPDVSFADDRAFCRVNTPEDMARWLETPSRPGNANSKSQASRNKQGPKSKHPKTKRAK